MSEQLLLYCDAYNDSFTLAQEGTDIRQQFPELRKALDYAAKTIRKATPIRLYNERGKVIIESVIEPRHARNFY